MFLLNWWRKIHYEFLSDLNIGDEVEFPAKVEIAMGSEFDSWVMDPQGSQPMSGNFQKAGEKFIIRGRVSALGCYGSIHVCYPAYKPGHKPDDNMWFKTNSFCCSRINLKKVGYENHS